MNGDGWRYLAQGRSEIVELGDDTVPAVEEAHFFVALTRVLVRMHHPGDVTAARALVAHRDHGGEAQPRRSGTPTCRQHGRKHQTRLRHHFQKTTRIIAGAAVRTLHESMESPARLQIEGAHFGGPWFRTPPLLEQVRFGPGAPECRTRGAQAARDNQVVEFSVLRCVFCHECAPLDEGVRRSRPCDRICAPTWRVVRLSIARPSTAAPASARRYACVPACWCGSGHSAPAPSGASRMTAAPSRTVPPRSRPSARRSPRR